MVYVQGLLLLQVLLDEWKAERTIDQTICNIHRKFGSNSITKAEVKHHYERFGEGDQTVIHVPIPDLPINDVLRTNWSFLCEIDGNYE
jgi:hypothetical protein